MNKDDIEKLKNTEVRKIAKSIAMKQSFYNLIMNSTFVQKTKDEFQGLPVYVDDDIENDYKVNY